MITIQVKKDSFAKSVEFYFIIKHLVQYQLKKKTFTLTFSQFSKIYRLILKLKIRFYFFFKYNLLLLINLSYCL